MGFLWDITADGSPTLRHIEALPGWETGESMHHSGGALEETLIVYGEPLKEIFAKVDRPHILSLGLGMGYVELVTAAEAMKQGKTCEIYTLESVQALIDVFEKNLLGEWPEGEIKTGLDEVIQKVAEARGLAPKDLKEFMAQMVRDGSWVCAGALSADRMPTRRFHGILYDAFSAKTNPELWTEDFLNRFVAECTEQDCLFSTYACTGALKRALRGGGFEVIQRDGFKGKRHSTLGRRGVFRMAQEIAH